MKLFVLIFIVSIFSSSASGAARAASKNKAVAYGNIFVEARGKTIMVYQIERAHILEEIAKLKTKLPIRCLALLDERYILAFCRLGSIQRICMWDLYIPDLPVLLLVPDPIEA